MSQDGIGIKGYIKWETFDRDGNLKEKGETQNRIVNALLEGIIDAIDTGSMTDVDCLAIGTGTGQNVTSTALASFATYENSSGSTWNQSQPSATQLRSYATFTCSAAGGWTITEVGLFTGDTGTAGLYAYDDSLNVALSLNDTIKITYTLATA